MKILITGATGYIGKMFSERFNSKYEIAALSRRKPELDLTFFPYSGQKSEIDKAFTEFKPDLVIHFASKFIVDHNEDNVEDLIDSNIKFGALLLESMKKNNCLRMVNIGTSWQHFNSDNYVPVNLYAATKEAFEKIIEYYVDAENFEVITLKLYDTYGPDDARSKILNIIKKYAHENKTLDATNGEQLLNIMHVYDVLDAVEYSFSLFTKKSSHKKFLLSSAEVLSLREIVKIYNAVNEKKINVKWGLRPYRKREVMIPVIGKGLPGWSQKILLNKGLAQL